MRGAPSTYQVERPGGDVLLDCDARGHPAPFIRWSKDGVPVVGSRRLRQLQNGSLAIRSLGVSGGFGDGGRFWHVLGDFCGKAEHLRSAFATPLWVRGCANAVVTPGCRCGALPVRGGERGRHGSEGGHPGPAE